MSDQGQNRKSSMRAHVFRFAPNSVEKVFLGWRPKFSRTTDAFRGRRYEGPHCFTQKRPWTFVAPLQSPAAARTSKNQLSRDFRSSPIFDFCNSIPLRADIAQRSRHVGFVPIGDVRHASADVSPNVLSQCAADYGFRPTSCQDDYCNPLDDACPNDCRQLR
jgi:hypothetical protein